MSRLPRVTLEHMRIAARQGRRKKAMCYDETMKVFEALEAAAPDFRTPLIYKYVKAYDDCMEQEEKEKKRNKPTTLHYLNQCLDQQKQKRK